MTATPLRAALAATCLGLLAACTTTSLDTKAQLPPPLLEQLPVRVGIHYSEEFRNYVHKETRGSIDYEVGLGPAHVTNLDWLLKAMFREIVHVDDPTRVAALRPQLAFVLEPKFEEYSFLTPKDVAGEAFIVTIRYLLTVYDGGGARVDSFTFTGYGREKARTLASKEPLAIATQRAMRDAGAKVAVELTDQDSVRLLLRGAGSPLPASPPAPPDVLQVPSRKPDAPGAAPLGTPPAPAGPQPQAAPPADAQPGAAEQSGEAGQSGAAERSEETEEPPGEPAVEPSAGDAAPSPAQPPATGAEPPPSSGPQPDAEGEAPAGEEAPPSGAAA